MIPASHSLQVVKEGFPTQSRLFAFSRPPPGPSTRNQPHRGAKILPGKIAHLSDGSKTFLSQKGKCYQAFSAWAGRLWTGAPTGPPARKQVARLFMFLALP